MLNFIKSPNLEINSMVKEDELMGKNAFIPISFTVVILCVIFSSISVDSTSISNLAEMKELTNYKLEIEENITYGGLNIDRGYDIIQTVDGGFAIGGFTESYGLGGTDAWLVKTNNSGAIEWNKTYGGMQDEEAHSIISTPDGGYALAGYTESFGMGTNDMWLVKTDSNGNIEWNETYGDDGYQGASTVIRTSDEGFLLAGTTRPFGANFDYNIWIVKTNKFGVPLWNQTYGGAEDENAWSIISTFDGGYAIAGHTRSYSVGENDFWLVKINTTGGVLWNQTYGGLEYDEAIQVIQTVDGGYALTGYTFSYGEGLADLWLVKTNQIGGIQWNHTYGGPNFETSLAFFQTLDGGYALIGAVDPLGNGFDNMWFIKTDDTGVLEHEASFGGSQEDIAFSGLQTNETRYVIIGSTMSFGEGNDDLWMIIFSLVSEIDSSSTTTTDIPSSTSSSLSTTTEETSITTTTTTPSLGVTLVSFIVAIIIIFRRNKKRRSLS